MRTALVPFDEFGNYGSQEAMEAAHARVSAFNCRQGHWGFAGGLDQASRACGGQVEVRPFAGLS